MRCGLLCLTGRTNDDNGMLTGANIAKLLTCLTFDDKWVFVMTGKLVKVAVMIPQVLKLLLSRLYTLHEQAIRPCLGQ